MNINLALVNKRRLQDRETSYQVPNNIYLVNEVI